MVRSSSYPLRLTSIHRTDSKPAAGIPGKTMPWDLSEKEDADLYKGEAFSAERIAAARKWIAEKGKPAILKKNEDAGKMPKVTLSDVLE